MGLDLIHHPESECYFYGEFTEAAAAQGCHPVDVTHIAAGTQIPVGFDHATVLPDFDFETYSEAGFTLDYVTGKVRGIGPQGKGGLPVIGTPVYAEHPSTEIICLYYDLKDGQGRRAWFPGTPDPVDLLRHIAALRPIEAHNVTFEFWIWNMLCVRRYGWPPLQLSQCHCSMAKARRFSMPGALGNLAQVLGTAQKDKRGAQLIQLLCRPNNMTKNRQYFKRTPVTDWDLFKEIYDYCGQDIVAEAGASARMPDLTPYERRVWEVDQTINVRGVQVDTEALSACIDVMRQAERRYTLELAQITQGAVGSVSEVAKITAWLLDQGTWIDNLQAETVTETLAREDIAPQCRRVLEIRSILGGANVKKLYTLDRSVSSDGRLRDQYMYCGADRTGRASSGGVQLQNLTSKGPKSKTCYCCGRIVGKVAEVCPDCGQSEWTERKDWTVEAVEWALRDIATCDLDYIVAVWGDPADVLAGCLRGLFIAAPGKDLICADFSAIEAVVAACVSRCQWRIDVFSTHGKIYETGAAKITGIPFEEMMACAGYTDLTTEKWWEAKQTGAHHETRKTIGKVSELACFTHNTLVLTRRGYVSMAAVKLTDKLWDGVEWVEHAGVLHKGKRGVIKLDGIEVTPNHPISLGPSWKEARLLNLNKSILSRALAIGSENLPSFARLSEPVNKERDKLENAGQLFNVPAVLRSTSHHSLIFIKDAVRVAVPVAIKKPLRLILSCIQNMRTFSLTQSIDAVLSIGYVLQSHDVTAQTANHIKTMVDGVLPSVTNGGKMLASFYSTSLLWKGGTNLLLKWTEKILTKATSPVIYVLSHAEKICSIKDLSLKCKPELMNLKNVYDIVNAGPRHRFTIRTDSGHLLVHNSGYGGWVGAWKNFGADKFMDDGQIKEAVLAWRAASPEIVDMWGGQFRWCGPGKWDYRPELFGLEGAVIQAICSPGQWFGHLDARYIVRDDVLYCQLPSGRFLHYHRPKLVPAEDKLRRGPAWAITYEGFNTDTKKGPRGWIVMETYGGSLFENYVQAIAADIQFGALVRLEDRNYPIVMHTHDEGTGEVPEGWGGIEEMVAIMVQRPEWASWWPIRAAGWRHKRYQKD